MDRIVEASYRKWLKIQEKKKTFHVERQEIWLYPGINHRYLDPGMNRDWIYCHKWGIYTESYYWPMTPYVNRAWR